MSKSQQRPWITGKKAATKSPFTKRTAAVSRWLHIYLSMASFAIVLFFAVTGLTLNHADWFSNQVKTATYKGEMAAVWLNDPDTTKLNKLQIVEFLRNHHQVKAALTDFRIEDSEVSLSFKGPGYSSDAFIERVSGKYEFSETKMGLVAVLNDLHKGRDSGKGWGWVIDASAVFMSLISLSGLILLLFLKRRRFSGLIVAAFGLLLCYVIYLLFVP